LTNQPDSGSWSVLYRDKNDEPNIRFRHQNRIRFHIIPMTALNPKAPNWTPPIHSQPEKAPVTRIPFPRILSDQTVQLPEESHSISGYGRSYIRRRRPTNTHYRLSATEPTSYSNPNSPTLRHPRPRRISSSYEDSLDLLDRTSLNRYSSHSKLSDSIIGCSSLSVVSRKNTDDQNSNHDPLMNLTLQLLESELLVDLRPFGMRLIGGTVRLICQLTNDPNINRSIEKLWSYIEHQDIDLLFNPDQYLKVRSVLESIMYRGLTMHCTWNRIQASYKGCAIDIFFSTAENWNRHTYFSIDALSIDSYGQLINPFSGTEYIPRISTRPVAMGDKITHSNQDVINDIVHNRMVILLPLPNDKLMTSLLDRALRLYDVGFSPTRIAGQRINQCYRVACRQPISRNYNSAHHYVHRFWNSKIYVLLSCNAMDDSDIEYLPRADKCIHMKLCIFNSNCTMAKWIHTDHTLSMEAMSWSANVGYLPMIRLLLSEYQIPLSSIELRYLLLIALYHNRINVATYLIRYGATLIIEDSSEWNNILLSIYTSLFANEIDSVYQLCSSDGTEYSAGYEAIVCGHTECSSYSPCSSSNYKMAMERLNQSYLAIRKFDNGDFVLLSQ
jgi:hypothetical protein